MAKEKEDPDSSAEPKVVAAPVSVPETDWDRADVKSVKNLDDLRSIARLNTQTIHQLNRQIEALPEGDPQLEVLRKEKFRRVRRAGDLSRKRDELQRLKLAQTLQKVQEQVLPSVRGLQEGRTQLLERAADLLQMVQQAKDLANKESAISGNRALAAQLRGWESTLNGVCLALDRLKTLRIDSVHEEE